MMRVVIFSALVVLSVFHFSSAAFPIPQPKQEQVASKIAFIQIKANQGIVEAQYLYGLLLLSGKLIAQDVELGTYWLTQAAEQDHNKAQRFMADMAFDGQFFPRNLALAEKWYLRLNDPWAHFRLGFIYAVGGTGIKRDCGLAVEQFLRAGDETAKSNAVWVMATCPDDEHRNGAAAVELGEQLYQTNPASPTILDNLAAAYAAKGEFNKAIMLQHQAIEALTSQQDIEELDEFRQRLNSYQQHKPIREVISLP